VTEPQAEPAGPTRRAVAGYILFRLALGIALLILAGAAVRDRPGHLGQMSVQFGLAGVLFLAMGTSAALLNPFGRRDWFIWSQLLIDTVFATALVSVTDGPISPFFPLYFVNIVAAAWLLPPRGALVVALFDGAAYGLVLGLLGLEQSQVLFGQEPLLMYSQITLQVFAFLLVGLLAGMLSDNVRRARSALAEQVQETRALQEKHDLILDQLDSGVVITDAEGVIIDVNPWAQRTLSVELGTPLDELLRVDGRSWEQAFGEGATALYLLCGRTDLEGGGDVTVIEDVTRLREMEAVVAREERLSAVGRLAAGLAHEVRNPLASLSGSVQLLREVNPSPLHDIVLREVKRLNELVEDFLDSARPVSLDLVPLPPGDVIGEVATAFRNDERYQGRRVVRTHFAKLPLVRLDGARFRQVLWNLVLNAAQATPDYGTIDISAQEDSEWLVVIVADNGVGMSADALRLVFDPFYTTRSGGTGLGLANVDRIVRAHGGGIDVDSEPGEGTRFVLRFPLRGPALGDMREVASGG
jgi:two-component system, NtrC family, sensor histidine kinase PilS